MREAMALSNDLAQLANRAKCTVVEVEKAIRGRTITPTTITLFLAILRADFKKRERAELSKQARERAKRLRKARVWDASALLAFKEKHARKHGTARGWQKAVAAESDLSVRTVQRRLKRQNHDVA